MHEHTVSETTNQISRIQNHEHQSKVAFSAVLRFKTIIFVRKGSNARNSNKANRFVMVEKLEKSKNF